MGWIIDNQFIIQSLHKVIYYKKNLLMIAFNKFHEPINQM